MEKGTNTVQLEGYNLRTCYIYGYKIYFRVGDGTNRYGLYSISRIDDGSWHHVVGVWDNGLMKIYIDGILENTTSYPINIQYTSVPLYIGNSYWNNHEFGGNIDEVRIYERVLSDDEILYLYAQLSEYIRTLPSGWSIVSLPFAQNKDKNLLMINHSSNFYYWDNAVNIGLVSDFVFGWDSLSQSYFFADEIDPTTGYWIYAYDECELWG